MKLHGNNLKYYGLLLILLIILLTAETPASFSCGILIWIGKYCRCSCIQFIFDVAWSFVGLSHKLAPNIIITRIPIWDVRWPYIKGDTVAGIFWQPRKGSSAFGSWRRDLLPDIGSSNCHPLVPEQHYLHRHLMLWYVVSIAKLEGEWRHNLTINSDHPPNTMTWTKYLLYIY